MGTILGLAWKEGDKDLGRMHVTFSSGTQSSPQIPGQPGPALPLLPATPPFAHPPWVGLLSPPGVV